MPFEKRNKGFEGLEWTRRGGRGYLLAILESGKPVLDHRETPGWATPEMTSAWVSALRRGKWWDPAKEPPDWWTDYRPDA